MIIAETPRLLIRQFHRYDLEPIAELYADEKVMHFGSGTKSREWVADWLRRCREEDYTKQGFGLWAVVRKQNPCVLGFCGLSVFLVDEQEEFEIGYRLRKPFWGRGYASEAAIAVRDYSQNVLCLSRLISIIEPANVRSIRVAEKAGMTCEKETICFEKHVRIYSIETEKETTDE